MNRVEIDADQRRHEATDVGASIYGFGLLQLHLGILKGCATPTRLGCFEVCNPNKNRLRWLHIGVALNHNHAVWQSWRLSHEPFVLWYGYPVFI